MGFRRSGDHIYRPHCAKCNACVPSRVVTNEFQRSKSQEHVWRRNSDLTITEVDSIERNEAYDLYRRYIEGRHADGDMYPPDRDQYSSFLNNGLGCTRYFEFRHDDKLIAILVTDQMLDGLSAIYTFYDPTEEKRSLGTLSVLFQIEEARRLDLDYVYLGYWIQNCDKMNYKARFGPLELLQGGCWQRREKLPAGGDLGPSMPLRFVDKPQ